MMVTMRTTLSSFLVLLLAMPAAAHFVFVVPDGNQTAASVFISETLNPDPAVDIELVRSTKLSWRDSKGAERPIPVAKAGGVYRATWTMSPPGVLHGMTDIGISGTAEKPYLLLYHPKAIIGDAFAAGTVVGSAPVEIVPQGRAGAVSLLVLGRGKPLADAEVTVLLPDATEKIVKTNRDGITEAFTQTGRYGAWARFWETNASGERDGKTYAETRHYATLTFTAGSAASPSRPAASLHLPQPAASFGAVAADGWLYVYGGHISPTHNYFSGAVSGRFDRIRLTGEGDWESLPPGPPAQGLNLAAHRGVIYRAGGMTPRNERGKPADNHSIADVARFNPVANKWEALPALPEARSSHDVVVIGDRLYVVGGWDMRGKAQKWADTLLSLDLSQVRPLWTPAAQPFKRRALIAAAFEGKLYAIGGMDERDVVSRAVSIYDPATMKWSEGPPLPQEVFGFGPAAVVHEGRLYVSAADGALLRLNAAAGAWEKVAKATPRVAHRLVVRGPEILVLGGADGGKNLDLVEGVNPQ